MNDKCLRKKLIGGGQAEEFKAAAALQDLQEEDGGEALMKQLYNAATAYSQVKPETPLVT